MSKVAVLPSYKMSPKKSLIDAGLRAAQVRGLEQLSILADTKEREVTDREVEKFVEAHKNDGVILEPVVTKWISNPRSAVKERNEALLGGVETVIVLGPVVTQTVSHLLSYAFGRPEVKVVQIDFDGKAEIVGAQSIMCFGDKYRPTPKKLAEQAATGWGEFTK